VRQKGCRLPQPPTPRSPVTTGGLESEQIETFIGALDRLRWTAAEQAADSTPCADLSARSSRGPGCAPSDGAPKAGGNCQRHRGTAGPLDRGLVGVL